MGEAEGRSPEEPLDEARVWSGGAGIVLRNAKVINFHQKYHYNGHLYHYFVAPFNPARCKKRSTTLLVQKLELKMKLF